MSEKLRAVQAVMKLSGQQIALVTILLSALACGQMTFPDRFSELNVEGLKPGLSKRDLLKRHKTFESGVSKFGEVLWLRGPNPEKIRCLLDKDDQATEIVGVCLSVDPGMKLVEIGMSAKSSKEKLFPVLGDPTLVDREQVTYLGKQTDLVLEIQDEKVTSIKLIKGS